MCESSKAARRCALHSIAGGICHNALPNVFYWRAVDAWRLSVNDFCLVREVLFAVLLACIRKGCLACHDQQRRLRHCHAAHVGRRREGAPVQLLQHQVHQHDVGFHARRAGRAAAWWLVQQRADPQHRHTSVDGRPRAFKVGARRSHQADALHGRPAGSLAVQRRRRGIVVQPRHVAEAARRTGQRQLHRARRRAAAE
eukprot:13171-Chlamydomonas_euryale.AAC.2